MQVKEGGQADVEEIVAVTMGPESAVRALHKAVSLGADRSVHLTDESLAGSDVAATGYALAKVLESESPDLVLLGQQSDDGECYTIGAVVADHLKMPSLTQVIKMDVEGGPSSAASARPSTATTPWRSICRPSSPSATRSTSRATRRSRRSWARRRSSSTRRAPATSASRATRSARPARARSVLGDQPAAREAGRRDHRGRGHRRDGRADRLLARGKEAPGMSGILDLRPPLRGRVQQELPRRSLRGRQARRRARRRGARGRRRRRRHRRPLQAARQVRRHEGLPRPGPRGPRRAGRRRHGQADRGQRLRLRRSSAAACWASRSAPAWPPACTAA